MTQPFDFSPHSTVQHDEEMASAWYLVDNISQTSYKLSINNTIEFMLGKRNKKSIVPITGKYISKEHCKLVYDPATDSFSVVPLQRQKRVLRTSG